MRIGIKIVETNFVDVQLTVDNDAYTSGDNVGGLKTFEVHSVGGGGRITQISLFDDDDLKAVLNLHIYHEKPTVFVDDEAFAPTFPDLKKELQKVEIAEADYVTQNGNAVAHKTDLTIDYKCVDGANLYFNLVCTTNLNPDTTSAYYLRVYYLAN